MPTPPPFLARILEPYARPPPASRPHVTLTFAQSLDAKIAGAGGRQLILSGRESMIMTHWMRTMHDGILVGIGTALNDNPQLNVRQLPRPPADAPYSLPQPIIIDPKLQLSPTCKLLQNFQSKMGKRPWLLCPVISDNADMAVRKHTLEALGARVVEVPHTAAGNPDTHLPIVPVLQTLRNLGIQSLMVEGGARIIASFLCEDVVDTLIVTVAPVLVGAAGVSYQYPSSPGEQHVLKASHTEIVGGDTVVCLYTISPPVAPSQLS